MTDYVTKDDLRRVLEALEPSQRGRSVVVPADIYAALRALDAPQEQPKLVHGPENGCAQRAWLPVPGEGDCPAWATHIVWCKREQWHGRAIVTQGPSSFDEAEYVTVPSGRSYWLPAYDDPARAGTCVALTPQRRAAKVVRREGPPQQSVSTDADIAWSLDSHKAEAGRQLCPDGDSCPDARRYGSLHEQPADPLPELPHVAGNFASVYDADAYRELRTYAVAIRERCERAEAELASLKDDVASLSHPVCKLLLADKELVERELAESQRLLGISGSTESALLAKLSRTERERDEARALAWEQACMTRGWFESAVAAWRERDRAASKARADERKRCIPVATVACFDGVSGRGEVEWMHYNMNDLGHVLERGETLYAIRALGKEEGK